MLTWPNSKFELISYKITQLISVLSPSVFEKYCDDLYGLALDSFHQGVHDEFNDNRRQNSGRILTNKGKGLPAFCIS